MKRKLLFSIIPLCLSLVACNNSKEKMLKSDFENVIETTDADDKDFLNAEIKYLNLDNLDIAPTIGLQCLDNGTDVVSFRFIGAVKLTDKNNDGTVNDNDFAVGDVIWERTAYNNDSAVFAGKELAEKYATKVYTYISANGEIFDIEDFNKEHHSKYTHFVTYVIRNVPSDLNTSVLMANVRVNGGKKSNTLVTTIDKSTQFSFDSDAPRFFLVKKHADGMCETYTRSSLNRNTITGALERFEITLEDPNDSVLVVDHDTEYFTYNNDITNNYVELERVGQSSFVKPKTLSSTKYIVEIDSYNNIVFKVAREFTLKIRVENPKNKAWVGYPEKLEEIPNSILCFRVWYLVNVNNSQMQYSFLYNYKVDSNGDYFTTFIGEDWPHVRFGIYDKDSLETCGEFNECDWSQHQSTTTLTARFWDEYMYGWFEE